MTRNPKDITVGTPDAELPDYWEASEVRDIAETLIPEWHGRLRDLSIVYLFQKKAQKDGDTVQLGKAARKSKKDQIVAEILGSECHFVLTISWDTWKYMDNDKKVALVDHELTHCETDYNEDGDLKLKIRKHDIEEFHEIIERRGLWNVGLENTKKVLDGLQLDLFHERPEAAEGGA